MVDLELNQQLAKELRDYVWQRCRELNQDNGRAYSSGSKNGVSGEVGLSQPPPSSRSAQVGTIEG